MATEREYRKWQAKRRKSYRPNKGLIWLIGLIAISFWLTGKNRQPFFNVYVPEQSTLKTKSTPKLSPENINPNPIQLAQNDVYTRIDNQATSINYQGTSISELASILSRYATTDAEKARMIYTWIAYNIAYDVPAYLSGNYGDVSAEGVLKNRRGVCSGYANLYQALAKAMGLEAVVIEGYAKGASYIVGSSTDINHAWNAVKINQVWYLLDPTWGAGIVNNGQFIRQFNPHYFATAPNQFIYDHLPVEKDWQLLSVPYTKETFDLLPEVSPQFFKDGLEFVNYNTHTIPAQGTVEVKLKAPPDVLVTAHLSYNGSVLKGGYTLVQRQGDYIIITASFPYAGNYDLQIFSKSRNTEGIYPHAVTYRVIAQSSGQELPVTYQSFVANNAYLYGPLTKHLPSYQSVNFSIDVPSALDVVVIDESSGTWTPLPRQGNLFSGYVKIGAGKVKISAKFPGDERYWDLAEYD